MVTLSVLVKHDSEMESRSSYSQGVFTKFLDRLGGEKGLRRKVLRNPSLSITTAPCFQHNKPQKPVDASWPSPHPISVLLIVQT